MKLSIITVSLNNIKGLTDTVESVCEQSYKDFEFLIIDGGSSDGSKEYLEKIDHKLTYWQSQKDNGIYDAMNIGINNASGEYLLFLNSGDTFFTRDIIENVVQLLVADIVYGDIEMDLLPTKTINIQPAILTFNFFRTNRLPHQSSFIKKKLFKQFGMYNTDMLICSDWAFFLDAICKFNVSYQYIPTTISSFKSDGISSAKENLGLIHRERHGYLEANYPAFLHDYESTEFDLAKFSGLKNSRVRKLLSILLPQLRV